MPISVEIVFSDEMVDLIHGAFHAQFILGDPDPQTGISQQIPRFGNPADKAAVMRGWAAECIAEAYAGVAQRNPPAAAVLIQKNIQAQQRAMMDVFRRQVTTRPGGRP